MSFDNENDSQIMLARIDVKVSHIEADVKKIEQRLEHYTLLSRFTPIERSVFGIIAIVGAIIIGAVLVKLGLHA